MAHYILTGVRTGPETVTALEFARKDDLEHFRDFCRIYQRCGYADDFAYWIEDESEALVSSLEVLAMTNPLNRLDQERLEHMSIRIEQSRAQSKSQVDLRALVPVLHGMVDGVIGFRERS